MTILKHLQYDPWYALAEFVDNAIDSYLKNEKQLKKIEGKNYQLKLKLRSTILITKLLSVIMQQNT
ncbi:MAG: hypothetical protein IPM38_03155 [Ignavibacteria bacterium]|nr:hypothetical protein [Ignavibacteria bacterium]